MVASPSNELLSLLARLGLAAPAEVLAVARRAKRLAKGLPLLDCVWVDALAQAGLLTPFQATEINAGRAERLVVESFILRRPVTCTPYAEVYEAIERDSRCEVRLLTTSLAHVDRDAAEAQLKSLVSLAPRLAEAGVDHVPQAGLLSGETYPRLWAAVPSVDGVNVADWMTAQGRMAPPIVLEVARQMATDLRVLERFGLVHGDLAPAALILTADGCVHVPHPGIRPLVRPEEGYWRTELPPAAYETLSPERIVEAAPPDVQSELFACGCLWWHLLAGRSPIVGGDSLAKLNSVRAARISDIRRLAPETPPQLAAVITRCVQADPARRGETFAEVMAQLGPSTRDGRQAIAEQVRAYRHPAPVHFAGRQTPRRGRRLAVMGAALAGCLLALVGILYPLWSQPETAHRRGQEDGRISRSMGFQPVSVDSSTPDTPSSLVVSRAAQTGLPARSKPTSYDPAVAPAAFQAEGPSATDEPKAAEEIPATTAGREDVLILEASQPVRSEALDLRAGRIVRGPQGTRPQIVVGHDGIQLSHSNVQFQNVDFVCSDAARTKALLVLAAARVEFYGCTFQGPAETPDARPVAVLCTGQSNPSASPAPRSVVFDRCTLRHVLAAVEARGPVIAAVEADQTLLVQSGALLRTDVRPWKQPLSLSLKNVTVRACDCVIDIRYHQIPPRPARISVVATDAVFAPSQAIWRFLGPQPPLPALRMVRWTGEGSLLDVAASVASWQLQPGGSLEQIDDSEIDIDGLARSHLTFAGEQPTAADSKLVQWAAPFGGASRPGIDPALQR